MTAPVSSLTTAASSVETAVSVDHPEGLWDILAAVAAKAIDDYRRKVEPGAHMPAAAFLASCGLLLPDGTIDTRGMHLAPLRTRRKA